MNPTTRAQLEQLVEAMDADGYVIIAPTRTATSVTTSELADIAHAFDVQALHIPLESSDNRVKVAVLARTFQLAWDHLLRTFRNRGLPECGAKDLMSAKKVVEAKHNILLVGSPFDA